MTNQLTTIARLPGSGAGCAAALRAETAPAEKKVEKPASGPFDLMMRDITKIVINAVVSDFMKTFEAQAIVQKLKEPAPGKQFGETCRAKFTDASAAKPDADFLDITSVAAKEGSK